jgi:23S rRNA (cytosine1962-C5)-methyltransferase
MISITLKSGKDQSIRRYHPWIFSGAIKKMSGTPQEGELVEIYDNKFEYLATGHYQNSSIAVRIISFHKETIDQNFWNARIQKAVDYRRLLGLIENPETNCFRLIHAEGDNLPGLIIDWYNGVAVMQMHSVGMYLHMNEIITALKTALGDSLKGVYNKSGSTLPFKAETDSLDGLVWGAADENHVLEYGNSFLIDWEKGQKTGFFIDQRENRKLVEHYAKDKSVLNTFCYTGGFSVFALRGGALHVDSVDSSARAIDVTNETIERNFPACTNHTSIATDAFDYLETCKDKYDMIILDPPAFAKHNNVLNNALQGYKRLNIKAIQNIKPGGILFTFSCSQVVSKEMFRKSVFAAAANTGRNVKILHQLNQPQCHPINIYHPESEYLKGLVLFVE